MSTNEDNYWRQKCQEVSQEYDSVVDIQRREIEKLQKQCADLVYERGMSKAACAMDIRNFLVEYQKEQKKKKTNASVRLPVGKQTAPPPRSTDSIPLPALLQHLSEYSNGLVPAALTVEERKRIREEVPAPNRVQQRFYQRLLAQHYRDARLHEGELEALAEEHRAKTNSKRDRLDDAKDKLHRCERFFAGEVGQESDSEEDTPAEEDGLIGLSSFPSDGVTGVEKAEEKEVVKTTS